MNTSSQSSGASELILVGVCGGAVAAALQAVAWRSQRAARLLLALPTAVVLLVFFIVRAPNESSCCARTKQELTTYALYTVMSLVFMLVWLAALETAAQMLGSDAGGVCASGGLALMAWLACMAALLVLSA